MLGDPRPRPGARARARSCARMRDVSALEQRRAVEQQEEGEGEHDDRLDEVVEDADRDLLQRPGGVAELRGQLRGLLGEQLR